MKRKGECSGYVDPSARDGMDEDSIIGRTKHGIAFPRSGGPKNKSKMINDSLSRSHTG